MQCTRLRTPNIFCCLSEIIAQQYIILIIMHFSVIFFRVENETVVLHYISYGMRIAVVKNTISQVYDDVAEKIQKHFHYSLNPNYINSHKKISYYYAV